MCRRPLPLRIPPVHVLEKIDTVLRLRERLSDGRRARGLVPTMGALHAGHEALIARARRECDEVVVSIFVNPLQFDNPDDLTRYPRTLEADVETCRAHGVDVVFAPSALEMYPQAPECTVGVGRLGDHLCGKFRPGHFQGVATVVLKLFGLIQPSRAYFGEKDAQQLAIVRRLVADFNVPVHVVGVPTVREADGLAMSSRNRHLSSDGRRLAVGLYRALVDAKERIAKGERNADAIRAAATACISESPEIRLEYFDIVDPGTLQPVDVIEGRALVAGALCVGSTRLIDNVWAP